jgi:hypothetical protein
MNKSLLFIMFGLLFLSAGYSALTDNIEFYYDFDETSGTTADDSANLYDGTLYGGVVVNQEGKIGKGFFFDGSGYVNSTYKGVEYSGWTLSIWVKPFVTSKQYVLGRTCSDGRHVWVGQQTSDWNGVGWGFNDGSWRTTAKVGTFDNGSWQHYVAVKNASHLTMWKNGAINSITAYGSNILASSDASVNCHFKVGSNGWADWYKGLIDEVGMWARALTSTEIAELYNSGNAYNPFTVNETNFNVTLITDNTTWLYSNASSSYLIEFNTTNNILIRTYNSSGLEVTQNITLTSPQLSAYISGANITSGTNISLAFNNASVTSYTLNFTNPFNASVWKTINVYIDEIEQIVINSSSQRFYANAVTTNLSFYGNHSLVEFGITCNDNVNITIPLLNITNRNVPLCSNTSITLNNSAVYNYTIYVTHDERGSLINNTYNFYTNAYNLSIPTYNSTIANNTHTDIAWYLSTITGYASSNQSYNVSINFNGTTTYPTASGLNYTYEELKMTDSLIETVTFTLFLNISYNGEYVNFTQPYSLTITTIQIDDCSVYTNQILNVSIKKETDRTTLIPFSNLIFGLEMSGALLSVTINNDTDGIIGICLNNSTPFTANATFDFSTVEFSTENETSTPLEINYGDVNKKNREHFYFNQLFIGVPIEQSLYKLVREDATKIILKLVDSAQQPVSGYYFVIKRWYAGVGLVTVAMAKTSPTGEAVTYVKYNEPSYAFDILNGNGVKVDETSTIVLTTTPTVITLRENVQDSYWTANGTLGYTNTWNNATGYFTSTMFSANGVDLATFNLFMYYLNGSLICNEYSGATTSYTVPCLASAWNTSSFMVKGVATTSKGNQILLFNYLIDEVITPASTFDVDEGLIWLGIIMIVMSMAFVGISPSFLPLAPAISLILTNVMGLTSISLVVIGGLGIGGMMFMLWFMRN